MTNCKRCGLCCCHIIKGKFTKCKSLVILPNGKTLCRNYKSRFKIKKAYGLFCGHRVDTDLDYEGCEYNTDKPLSRIISLFPIKIREGEKLK